MKVLSKRDRIAATGMLVVVVHDTAERVLAGFLHGLEIPGPVLVDTELTAYRAWGLVQGSAGSVLAPRVVLGYARRIAGGERLRRPGAEPLQLGGDFVVAADGTIAYAHPQAAFDDRPPAGVLVAELERAAGQRA